MWWMTVFNSGSKPLPQTCYHIELWFHVIPTNRLDFSDTTSSPRTLVSETDRWQIALSGIDSADMLPNRWQCPAWLTHQRSSIQIMYFERSGLILGIVTSRCNTRIWSEWRKLCTFVRIWAVWRADGWISLFKSLVGEQGHRKIHTSWVVYIVMAWLCQWLPSPYLQQRVLDSSCVNISFTIV